MEKYNLIKEKIKLHNIILCYTSEIDYEMSRYLILEGLDDIGYDEYIFVEGYHCSCYDFDDTEWEAIKYTKDELIELAKVKIDDKSHPASPIKNEVLPIPVLNKPTIKTLNPPKTKYSFGE